MIHAKKLIVHTKDQANELQEQEIEIGTSPIHLVIKVMIMLLLTYVIIFM